MLCEPRTAERIDADAFVRIGSTLEQSSSIGDVEQVISRASATYGYTHYLITDTPNPTALTDRGSPLFCNWPSAWLLRYMEDSWAGNTPFAPLGGMTCEPFVWRHSSTDRSQPDVPPFIPESGRFGLGSGVCIPSYGSAGLVAGAILSGFEANLQPITIGFLQTMLLLARDKLARLKFKQSVCARRRLSNRERQILTWTALGKSAWDISCILGISEVTAHKHVSSAMKKLNAVNKAHAVAAALLAGEISL